MAGRTGDSFGTLGGVLLSESIMPLVLVASILFVIVILMFFSLYNKLYNSTMTESERKQQQYETFENKYTLSRRESEVFRLIVQGLSNLEISGALYVSESTVKYHVGNILKKTGCSNRTTLTMRFREN
ncbi:MAG: response regulator transcription factor [Clostridiales bacterium]|nr:response regulator transcription factor [Clostridiales bacterium]